MAARLAMDRELALRMRQSQQHMTPPLPGAGTAHMQGMNSSAGAKVPTPQQLYQQRQQQLTAASYHAAAGGGGGVTPEMSHHQSQLSITGGYHGSQMAAGSNRSGLNHLLGNVPADDILYLKCNLCGSTYGSVHNFRKHFQRVHSREPTGEHVTVQSISQTKHALKTEDDDKVPEILHKSQAYSRMSAGDSELDTRGMSYHHHAAYVSQASSQHHGAMQHQQYQSAVPARKLMEDKAVSVPGADTPPAAGVRRATPDSTYTEAPAAAAPPQQHGDDKPRSDSETVGLSRPEGTAASGHQNCQKVTNILSMIQQKVIENFTQSQSSSNNSYGLSSTATCNSNTQLVSTNSSTTQLSSKPATAGGDQSPSVTAYQHPKKRKYLYDYANMSTPEKQIKEEPPEETLPIERNNTRMLLDKIVENAVEEYVKIVPVSQSSQVPKQPYRIPVGVPLTNVKQLVEKSQNSPKAMEHNLPLSNSTQSSMLHYPRPEASSSLYPREFHDSNSSSSSSDPSSERTKAPNSPSASGRETLKSAVDPVSKSDSENYMKSALQGILFSLPLIKKPGNVRDIIETIVHAEVMGTSSYSIMKAKEQTLNHVALPVTEINNGKIRAKHPGDATATATPGSLDNDDDSKAAVTPTNIKSEKSESEQPMSLLREMEHTIDKYIKHSNTETENAAATAAEVEATEAEAPTPVAAIEKSTSEETGGSRQVDTSSQEQVDNEQEVSDTKVKSDSNDGIQDKNHQAEVVNENSELKNEDKNSDEHIITESSVKETSACDAPPQKVFEQSHSIESEGELQICESENEGELQIDETTADDGVHVSHTSVNETRREENGNVEFAATDSKDTAPAPIDQATAVTEMEDSQSEGELKICESDGDS